MLPATFHFGFYLTPIGLKDILLNLILTLQSLPTSYLLPSNSGNKNLLSDLLRLNSAVNSNGFNIKHFANLSKYRKYVDNVLKEELGPLYVGIPSLYKAFFREIEGLKEFNLGKYIRELRFDSTILTLNGKRYIEIIRNGQTKRLILNNVIKRARYVAEREEEGKLLHNNIFNIYKGLDITKATNYKPEGLIMPLRLAGRSSSYSAPLPPGKRLYLTSPTKRPIKQNRPLYKAGSRAAILTALKGGIKGYESLYTQAGPAFLINFNFTIKEKREGPLGVRGKTSIRAFIAIGVLLGKKHSFKHNLESLAKLKLGLVNREGHFLNYIAKAFTPYY
ncbi:hypothetical protein V2W45_1472784 [Cenococcum geophilum]